MSSSLSSLLQAAGIALDGRAQERLLAYQEILAKASTLQNLTALRSPEVFLREGILDSLLAWQALGVPPQGVVDVGSGGGLPALVWCAAGLTTDAVLIEAERRKVEFLRAAAAELALAVKVIWGRAEEEARGALRDRARLVTARALAGAPVAVEVCGGLVQPGGVLCLLKGEPGKAAAEAEQAAPVAGRMGFGKVEMRRYRLEQDVERTLLLYRKARPTPPDRPASFARLRREFPSRKRLLEREGAQQGE